MDASWRKDNSFCSSGLIARNSVGIVLAGDSKLLRAPSPVVAEALSIREGIITALNLGWPDVILESDCQVAINACNGIKSCGEIKVIVDDILRYKNSFNSCSFHWACRKQNQVAHLIAQAGLQNSLRQGWVFNPPHLIARALVEDSRLIPPR